MGNVPMCRSKQNIHADNNIVQRDLHKIIPEMLSISRSEFKRIYKQSKKTKYTKKLQSNDDYKTISIDDIKLSELPSYKRSDSFIISTKSLINHASILSLVILKDIIFQIQTIPAHVYRYMHQYNAMYLLQLKQRYINIEELIMIHYGLIKDLYTTIYILLHIGYKSNLYNNYLVLLYEDLSYLDLIKFHISLKEKLNLGEEDYEQYKLQDKRHILYERLSEEKTINNIDNIAEEEEKPKNYIYLLISGYLEIDINDIIELCIKFYLIPNETNYNSMLSFSAHRFRHSRMKIDIYNFQKLSLESLEIEGLNSDGTHYMYLVRNIGLPKWIHADIDYSLGSRESIYDDKYFNVMNSKHLCCIYDQITYQTFDLNGISSNNNKQAMIVFDPNHINDYGGYNIEFAKNFALNLYLWNSTDRKIYHRGRNSIICLNRIGNKSILSEYDIDANKYNTLDGILHMDRCEGAGMCIFDNQTKLLLSGGKSQCIHYKNKCKCKTLKSNEIYHCGGEYGSEYDYFGHIPISNMNLCRMNHGLVYNKELQKIIVGGGQDRIGGQLIHHQYNSKEIDSYFNKYKYLTPHTIEIFDLNKNKWNLIECKTNNGYASNPILWYNNNNPFIINIFNSYLSYSGKRANHSEFIDIRANQKKFIQNNNINNYLKKNHTCHISMF